ncbi:MAG: RIP metalloprotease RseP [Lachnospiraceae bacterium]|nr:RIP metalloprotease RseP [Lachnospiraceae bacterium]
MLPEFWENNAVDFLGTIILFFIIFCVIVVSHEFGHLIIAKLNGIRVNEFTVGFGPKIFGFKRKGTEYNLRLLPFGGACIYDLDDAYLPDVKKEGHEEAKAGEDGKDTAGMKGGDDAGFLDEVQGVPFSEAKVGSRIATVFAGPLFNILTAYILAIIVVWFTGSSTPVITGLMEGYPAEEAGIQEGDVIVSMNGSKVYIASEIYINTYINRDKDMTIEYLRDGKKYTVTITPKYLEEEDRYLVGFNGYGEYVDCSNIKAFKYALYEVRYGFVGTLKSLAMVITGNSVKDSLMGPVGMAQTIGEVKDAALPYGPLVLFINMCNIAMLLSVNLGILNILPLPALDGGRLVFLIIEALRGKPVPPEKEGIVHLVGVLFLVALMIFVMYNDIMRLMIR